MPWDDSQTGLLPLLQKDQKLVSYSQRLKWVNHMWDKMPHGRNRAKQGEHEELECYLCLQGDDNQGHILLECGCRPLHQLRTSLHQEWIRHLPQTQEPHAQYLRQLTTWIFQPGGQADHRTACLLGRPLLNNLKEIPGHDIILSRKEQKAFQIIIRRLHARAYEYVKECTHLHWVLCSTPRDTLREYEETALTTETMEELLQANVITHKKRARTIQSGLEEYGITKVRQGTKPSRQMTKKIKYSGPKLQPPRKKNKVNTTTLTLPYQAQAQIRKEKNPAVSGINRGRVPAGVG